VGAVTGRLQNSALAPWAGLFLGAFGWFLHHQAGSNGVYYDCRRMGSAYVMGLGLGCALIVVLGAIISWAASPSGAAARPQNRGFARVVGVASAAIFLLAIGFQTLAGALLPPCLR
jgi:hypothetical protein